MGLGLQGMFEHPHHQKIATVLNSLDAGLFHKVGAYFGGGTLITLSKGEFRFSKDIDFMCPVGKGYRLLRTIVADSNSKPSVLFRQTDSLTFPRDIKADQYGIRFPVFLNGEPIKFEIIAEARIQLEPAAKYPWTDLPCLSVVDRFAEKLLANADRGMDESIQSRDLIDLAAMRVDKSIPPAAIEKAENAYPVLDPLKNSLAKFQQSESYRNKCFSALEIHDRPTILDGLDLLAGDHGLQRFERTWEEERVL